MKIRTSRKKNDQPFNQLRKNLRRALRGIQIGWNGPKDIDEVVDTLIFIRQLVCQPEVYARLAPSQRRYITWVKDSIAQIANGWGGEFMLAFGCYCDWNGRLGRREMYLHRTPSTFLIGYRVHVESMHPSAEEVFETRDCKHLLSITSSDVLLRSDSDPGVDSDLMLLDLQDYMLGSDYIRTLWNGDEEQIQCLTEPCRYSNPIPREQIVMEYGLGSTPPRCLGALGGASPVDL